MTNSQTNKHDVWYFEATTTINGEQRGFCQQTLARPCRHGETIPAIVRERCEAFLSSVVDGSDLHDYHAVTAGERTDWPYRSASYVLSCNGTPVVRSFAVRPVRPDVLV